MFRAMMFFWFATPALAGYHTLDVPPQAQEAYKTGQYRIWIPDGVKTIRAVIVRQHGCGRNGIDHADDLQWQALAAKHHAALLGSHFTTHKECAEWFDPVRGSERAFLFALKTFANQSQHPELETVPWAIWGHSGGSLWACHMLRRHPERVVCIWGRSQALTEYPEACLKVPMVFNYGEGEKAGRFETVHKNSMAAFEKYKPQGAVWDLAVDPKSSHDCRNSRLLAIRFMDEMLKNRLPGKIGDPLKPSPLPSAEWKKALEEYRLTGEVTDTTPPEAPFALTAVAKDGVSLEWKANVDVESGIQVFIIHKNGSKLTTVGGEKKGANKNGYFQVWNYGDEPEPKSPLMAYTDTKGKTGDIYTITQENRAGLASKPSAEVTAK
jgi:hypothetical protein